MDSPLLVIPGPLLVLGQEGWLHWDLRDLLPSKAPQGSAV